MAIKDLIWVVETCQSWTFPKDWTSALWWSTIHAYLWLKKIQSCLLLAFPFNCFFWIEGSNYALQGACYQKKEFLKCWKCLLLTARTFAHILYLTHLFCDWPFEREYGFHGKPDVSGMKVCWNHILGTWTWCQLESCLQRIIWPWFCCFVIIIFRIMSSVWWFEATERSDSTSVILAISLILLKAHGEVSKATRIGLGLLIVSPLLFLLISVGTRPASGKGASHLNR